MISFGLSGCDVSGQNDDSEELEAQPADDVFTEEERNAIDLATSALAKQQSIPEGDISVQSLLAQEWPDTSLGCPQPGAQYLQVISPGFRVRLTALGTIHAVHVSGKAAVVCERTVQGQPKQAPGPRHLSAVKLKETENRAVADLAQRMGATQDEVVIIDSQIATWQDASLGCPEPGKSYMRGHVQGFVLSLEYQGRTFTYHTDLERLFPCPNIVSE
jgi:hypothetical protein